MTVLTKADPLDLHAAVLAFSQGYTASADAWLPKIAPGDVAQINALYRHRRPIEAMVAGHALTIETAASADLGADAWSFRLTVSGRPAMLRLSAGLIEPCARSLAMRDFDRLGGVPAAMLLELALLRPIKALETRLGVRIRLEERCETTDTDARLIALQLRLRGLASGAAAAELLLERQSAVVLAGALDELAAPNPSTAQLPILVRICLDRVDLTVAELRSLHAGDIIMLDSDAMQPRGMVAVLGDRLQFKAEHAAPVGVRLGPRLVVSDAHAAGEWLMPQPNEALQSPAVDEVALDQLPIRVVFEVGRMEVPLAEVRRFAPGYVLPLARPSDSAVDVVANGRKIGHGSLVKIGDSVGVRVERLLSDD